MSKPNTCTCGHAQSAHYLAYVNKACKFATCDCPGFTAAKSQSQQVIEGANAIRNNYLEQTYGKAPASPERPQGESMEEQARAIERMSETEQRYLVKALNPPFHKLSRVSVPPEAN